MEGSGEACERGYDGSKEGGWERRRVDHQTAGYAGTETGMEQDKLNG